MTCPASAPPSPRNWPSWSRCEHPQDLRAVGSGRWLWVDLRLAPVAPPSGRSAPPPRCSPRRSSRPGRGHGDRRGCGGGARSSGAAALALAVLAGLHRRHGGGRPGDRAGGLAPLRSVAEAGGTVLLVVELDADHVLGSGGQSDHRGRDRHRDDRRAGLAPAGRRRAPLRARRRLARSAAGSTGPVRPRSRTARPGDDVVAVVSARGPPSPPGDPGPLQQAAGALRGDWPPPPGGSWTRGRPDLPGLVVGDTRSMDPVLDEDFQRAGLAHLTAVSGANVAIVLTAVLWPLRRRAVDRRAQAVAAVFLLIGFVVLAGARRERRPPPWGGHAAGPRDGTPTRRAARTGRGGCVLLSSTRAGRAGFASPSPPRPRSSCWRPGHGTRHPGMLAGLADALAVSAAAGLATAPLVAGLSGSVSLVSLPANLLAAPAVAPATVLGLAATVVGRRPSRSTSSCGVPAGRRAGWCGRRTRRGTDAATGLAGRGGQATLLTVLLLAVVWSLWRFPRMRPLALAALVGLVAIGWPLQQAVRAGHRRCLPRHRLRRRPGGRSSCRPGPAPACLLVDAGPDVGAVDRCLDRLGIDVLPLVLMSHLDADHAGRLAGRWPVEVGVVATEHGAPPTSGKGVRQPGPGSGGERTVLVPGDRRTVGRRRSRCRPDPERATAAARPTTCRWSSGSPSAACGSCSPAT